MSVNLSYIIATRNRLPFLKITLTKLINELRPEEEIVVVDGNSNDGSKEYLRQLFEKGKVHQYISEADHNQAHAWNKGMLMANGTIIKKIIDDDVHDYNAIRGCRDFMLTHENVDICISNILNGDITRPGQIDKSGRLLQYQQWKAGIAPAFTFSDVSLLLRKSSLSVLGLYDTQFTMMDWEYSLRASYLQLNIAYYTGYNSLTVSIPGSVTSRATKKVLNAEEKIGKIKYNYPGDKAGIGIFSHFKIMAGKFYYSWLNKQKDTGLNTPPDDNDLRQIYASYYSKLKEYNQTGQFKFII